MSEPISSVVYRAKESATATRVAQQFTYIGVRDWPLVCEYKGEDYLFSDLYTGKREPKSIYSHELKVGAKYWAVYELVRE